MTIRNRTRNTIASVPRLCKSTLRTLSPAMGNSYLNGYLGTVAGSSYTWGTGDFSTAYSSKVGVDETMTDRVGTPVGYNDCTHTKKVWKFPQNSLTLVGRSVGENGQTGKVCEAVSTYNVSADTILATNGNASFPSYWDSIANAKARATAKLELGFHKSNTNLGVFLGELKDFKEVYELCLKGFQMRKQLLSEHRWGYARSVFQRMLRKNPTFEHGLRWMAASDLFYQFAVKPVISDVRELWRMGERLRRERDRLLNAESIQRARAVVIDNADSILNVEGSANHWSYLSRKYERRTSAWCLYRWNIAEIPNVSDLRLGAEIYGLGQPLSIVWELIPFSFMVDYFIRIGDMLQAMDGSLVQVPYTLLYQGTSVKKTFRSTVKTSFDRGVNRSKFRNVSPPPDVYGEYEETTYTRTAEALPFGVVPLPEIHLPNLRQVANLAEIIYLRGKVYTKAPMARP